MGTRITGRVGHAPPSRVVRGSTGGKTVLSQSLLPDSALVLALARKLLEKQKQGPGTEHSGTSPNTGWGGGISSEQLLCFT